MSISRVLDVSKDWLEPVARLELSDGLDVASRIINDIRPKTGWRCLQLIKIRLDRYIPEALPSCRSNDLDRP